MKTTKVKAINIDFAKRVAEAYEKMKHEPKNPVVHLCYSLLAKETTEQYKEVLVSGLAIEFDEGQSGYKSPHDAIKDIRENNHLFVTPTAGNFGTDETFNPEGSPLLNYSGFEISGKPALINDLFRVVHDYYGHYKGKNGFRALGEENAFRFHCSMFSPLAAKALATETRGQNSWLNYGPYGEHNRTAKENETIFADQKTGLLPDDCLIMY